MITTIPQEQLLDYTNSQHLEWLETNGLGGYSSGSVIGINTRKYHGLFVAAQHPPVGRVMMVNKLEEELVANNSSYEFSSNQYPGVIAPKGFEYLETFEKLIFPRWTFQFPDGTRLLKEVSAINGKNMVIVSYELELANEPVKLKIRPQVSFRDHHTERTNKDNFHEEAFVFENNVLKGHPVASLPLLFVKGIRSRESVNSNKTEKHEASFVHENMWFHNVEYLRELDRGHAYREELFSPGYFEIELEEGDAFHLVFSTEEEDINDDAVKQLVKEFNRRVDLFDGFKVQDTYLQQLILAADQFIVKRGKNLKTIIAGYPWFSDWGRDTMISLHGLCLTTKRFKDAEKILKAFAAVIDKGMIPNRFPDENEEPEYNTVDATLWYFVALHQYAEATGDKELIQKNLWKKLVSIISWHEKGTRYEIKEQEDGLLFAGENGVQLTWMDAKINDWVVTPRIGKPVEIQALWYNALEIMALYASNDEEQKYYSNKAAKTKKSFEKIFWFKEGEYLYDNIEQDFNDSSLRPNQLLAISLPFELIESKTKKAKKILDNIEKYLLSDIGLRSLSPEDDSYKGIYEGDQLNRDGAYHQGTGWTWLLGMYVDAKIKIEGKKGSEAVEKMFKKTLLHLDTAGIGSVSEIFDGNEPFIPRGCFAQAWGVAEWLRVYADFLKEGK